jgi:hypothetical protein
MSSILWGFSQRWLLDLTGAPGPIGCLEMAVNHQSTLSKKKQNTEDWSEKQLSEY